MICSAALCDKEATHTLTQGGKSLHLCEYDLEVIIDVKAGPYAINEVSK